MSTVIREQNKLIGGIKPQPNTGGAHVGCHQETYQKWRVFFIPPPNASRVISITTINAATVSIYGIALFILTEKNGK